MKQFPLKNGSQSIGSIELCDEFFLFNSVVELTHEELLALACLDRAIATHTDDTKTWPSKAIKNMAIRETATEYLDWIKRKTSDA